MLHRGELEGRLDPFFYKLHFLELERKMRELGAKKLRDFIVKMASGATPSKSESEKYYTTADVGIPFVRVQNLTTTGHLDLTECKYINLDTHVGMLERSQVNENDLLVKITGVGRMAIASVPPEGFVGNINQHSVVIKTRNRRESEILAAYLNTDIAEKLASRRSTGGTRPALDFPALRSLPVLFDERILVLMEQAHAAKRTKEAEARALLESIDGYVLSELGITLPEEQREMVFHVPFSRLRGGRFDPFFHQPLFNDFGASVRQGRFQISTFRSLAKKITSGTTPLAGGEAYTTKDLGGIPFIRSGDINQFNEINFDDVLYLKPEVHRTTLKSSQLKQGDLLIAIVGATIGSVAVYEDSHEANINQALALVRFVDNVLPEYAKLVLKTSLGVRILDRLKRPVARANINLDEIASIAIPLPPLGVQKRIAAEAQARRERAKVLEQEGAALLQAAKREVERMIVGEPLNNILS